MPRRTRKQLVDKKEDRLRRERERALEALALCLGREWRGLAQILVKRGAA